ncbi:unnamed protein product [Cylicocyclus nassatus]|uniref:G-patch domain-containing protein n=1 Tax=Cylicocyclus nassatus TaxID=53992 RepID=A0AA36M3Z1_CYLNA|nr:unnamed protein product [Cylicocyclus nassatus]
MPNENDFFAVYGTEFEELEDEETMSKKPAGIQDQIVTDENGRRRFHGAFTGGFSAGYYNTVGSKEGWTPQEFKSSREQRAALIQQRAEDLMDEEDLGEFGIGARRIRTAEKFTSGKSAEKRMAWEHDVTTTSGTSIAQHLEDVIRPVSDSIGKRMLRAMGWREGRGVGLMTSKMKKQVSDFDSERIKAAAPEGYEAGTEDVLMTRLKSVEGIHGLGYEAMSASTVLDERYGRVASAFKAHAKSKGIKGQAFGVGAFEEDDENIYSNYDLDQFDFALDAPGTSEEESSGVDSTFVLAGKRLNPRKFYAPPKLPSNFRPAHRPIAPAAVKLPTALQDAMKTLTAIQRAKLLGEDRVSVMELVSDKDRKRLEQHRSRWDQRERSDQRREDTSGSKDRVEFPNEPMKQSRFKEYLKYLRRGLVLPQPKELTVWEWESERKEFDKRLTAEERGMLPEVRARAQPLAKSSLALPIQELLQNKFAKETGSSGHSAKHDSDKMAAVKMGMFGDRTRTTFQWYPDNVLAKRFNIPNPYPGAGMVGVPHLQKSTKKETLLNLGLPQTASEIAHRRAREIEHLEEEEAEEANTKELRDDDLDRPPQNIFDVIFGESDSESESETEEEKKEEKDDKKKEDDARKDDKEEEKEVKQEIKTEVVETVAEEAPKKPVTVMDIVDDDVDFGPAPPPSTSETITGFSVLKYLKEEIDKRKDKKKKGHKKHKSEVRNLRKTNFPRNPKRKSLEKVPIEVVDTTIIIITIIDRPPLPRVVALL